MDTEIIVRAFLLTMFTLFGIAALIVLLVNTGLLGMSKCGIAVNEPFEDIDNVRSGSILKLELNPNCLEEIAITGSTQRCVRLCRGEGDCVKNCDGAEGTKTFFVLVMSEGPRDESIASTLARIPLSLVGMGSRKDKNMAYGIPCSLNQRDILCSLGEGVRETKEERIRIDKAGVQGSTIGTCTIEVLERRNDAGQVEPPICKEIGASQGDGQDGGPAPGRGSGGIA